MTTGNRWLITLRRIVACILFSALFLSLLTVAEKMLMSDDAEGVVAAHEALPVGSVDVGFIGSSHIYFTVIPQRLMDDYGITSVNAASPLIPTWQNIDELEWLLQKQSPRLVVLDLFMLGRSPKVGPARPAEEETPNQRDAHFAGMVPRFLPWTNPLKYSVTLRETLLDSHMIPYLTAIGSHHTALWQIGRREMLRAAGKSLLHATFNYSFFNNLYQDFPELYPVPAPGVQMSEFDRDALLGFFRACKQKNIPLLILSVPHWPSGEWLALEAQAHLLAEEAGVDYLDMDTIIQECGFDFQTDMADFDHTNEKGAQKVTDYLGAYLKEHYDLPDRREDTDPRYDPWKKRPYQYHAYTAARYMHGAKELDEWAAMAESLTQDYVTIFACSQAYSASLDPESINPDLISLLELAGLESVGEFPYEDAGYLAILEGTELIEEDLVYGEMSYAAMLEDHPLTIRTQADAPEKIQLKLDNQSVNCGHPGLNILLYDKLEGRVMKSTCLDLSSEGIAFVH